MFHLEELKHVSSFSLLFCSSVLISFVFLPMIPLIISPQWSKSQWMSRLLCSLFFSQKSFYFSFTTLLSKLCMGNKKKEVLSNSNWESLSLFWLCLFPSSHPHAAYVVNLSAWRGDLPFLSPLDSLLLLLRLENHRLSLASLECAEIDALWEGKAEWVIKLLLNDGAAQQKAPCASCVDLPVVGSQ